MSAFKQHKNKIIIVCAVLLIALSAYVAAPHLTEEKHPNNDSTTKYERLFKAIKSGKNITANSSDIDSSHLDGIKGETYDVSYPTIGPLFITTPASITTETSQLLLKDKTAAIKEKQRVLFYSSEGSLAIEGEITSIEQAPDTNIKASYSLKSNTLTKTSEKKTVSSADIILRETGLVKRIPQSALSHEDGAYFVYLIKTKRDRNNKAIIVPAGKTIAGEITKQRVKKSLEDKWHAAVSHKIHKADLVLLKPNTDIKDGDLIKIHTVKSPPPVLSRTETWLKQVEEQRVIDAKAGQEKANDCDQPATGSASTANNETSSKPAGSCNTHPGGSDVPFDAFTLLGIARPASE